MLKMAPEQERSERAIVYGNGNDRAGTPLQIASARLTYSHGKPQDLCAYSPEHTPLRLQACSVKSTQQIALIYLISPTVWQG